MLSSTAMSKQSDGVSSATGSQDHNGSQTITNDHKGSQQHEISTIFLPKVLRELVSTREASMGVRKLCVRGGNSSKILKIYFFQIFTFTFIFCFAGLSYISMGGQYQDYSDTP